jgi:ABC-type enterochelin transport system ATPase subunit
MFRYKTNICSILKQLATEMKKAISLILPDLNFGNFIKVITLHALTKNLKK